MTVDYLVCMESKKKNKFVIRSTCRWLIVFDKMSKTKDEEEKKIYLYITKWTKHAGGTFGTLKKNGGIGQDSAFCIPTFICRAHRKRRILTTEWRKIKNTSQSKESRSNPIYTRDSVAIFFRFLDGRFV